MEESVVATRSQPLARITICIHASPRHVSWHACYTCIGRMYVSQGGNVFRKGAKPFRNCFPSPHRPKENPATCSSSTRATDLRQLRDLCKPSLPLDSPLDYFPRSFIDRYLSSPPPSTFLLLSEEKLRSKRNIKSDCPIAVCPLVLETILFLGKETRNSLDSFGFAGTRGGETRLWKIIIGRGGGGSFRTA